MTVYYNDNDPFNVARLKELIQAGLIAQGEVDGRSIEEINSEELRGFTQCHFFAGIGGWSYALRLAGWPDDRPVWTGSCPCQPFSVGSVTNGGAKGQRDERHLWPYFFRLIRERKPPAIFGEQVANAISWGWWDRAAMDLEAEAFACAAMVLRARTFGADHERRRLYWMADAGSAGRKRPFANNRVPCSAETAFTLNDDPFIRARRALDGDYSDLLPCDGLSVQLERNALKGYGNAIVPQAARFFIHLYMSLDQ